MVNLDDRELATVLAALRHWERELEHSDARDLMPFHFMSLEPLTPQEINALCVRLNTESGA